jgi:hypothetical protein
MPPRKAADEGPTTRMKQGSIRDVYRTVKKTGKPIGNISAFAMSIDVGFASYTASR